MARAREAALRSFDDLAELRADLNQTMASTSTHFATKCQAGESSTDLGIGVGMERCMGDLNGSGVSTFSGIFACNPPRGGMENTATILQGSIVIAEADALIMSFRQSYMAPSSSSKAGMFMSTTTTSASASAHPDNSVGMRNAIEDALEDRRSSSAMDRSTFSNDSHCDDSQHFLPSDSDNRGGSNGSNNNSHNNNKTVNSRKGDSANEFEMFAFLEKYSDRLADMVSDKMIAKSIAMDRSFKSP